jgi:flagellin
VVGGFNRDVNGLVTITTLDINVTSLTMIGAANEILGILTKDIDANALDPNATTGTARDYYLIDTGATTGTAGIRCSIAPWLRPPPMPRSTT